MPRNQVYLRLNTSKVYNNINIIECGYQDADPFHAEGPLKKTEYVLQYMLAGEGEYTILDKTYRIVPGDIFYLPKNVMLSYHTHQHAPYIYWWLGFDGELTELLLEQIGLTPEHPVIHHPNDGIRQRFADIYQCLQTNTIASVMQANGHLYDLFSRLLAINIENSIPIRPDKSLYIKQAIAYIHHNYSTDLTVAQIASFLSLNRTYFSVIFKDEMGISPAQYLLGCRLDQAKKLLTTTNSSVADISHQCGFRSANNFSIQFKKQTGYSPLQYRAAKRNAANKSAEQHIL